MNVDKLEGAESDERMNTNELIGAELDAAVFEVERRRCTGFPNPEPPLTPHAWSSDWAHGGPIIERERINLRFDIPPDLYNEYGDQPPYPVAWFAMSRGIDVKGPTPLIAAMRAFVASKKT